MFSTAGSRFELDGSAAPSAPRQKLEELAALALHVFQMTVTFGSKRCARR
jgi:hypothetical protein